MPVPVRTGRLNVIIQIANPKEALIQLLEDTYDAHRLVEKDGEIGIMDSDRSNRIGFYPYRLEGIKEALALYKVLTKKDEPK